MRKKIFLLFLMTFLVSNFALAEVAEKSVRELKRDKLLSEFKARKAESPLVMEEVAVPIVVAETPMTPSLTEGNPVETSAGESIDAETRLKQQKIWGYFPEASDWNGLWNNPRHHTGGVWINGKYIRWYTKYEKPENFGLGFNVRADYGKVLKNSDADWGYVALGPTVGYYRGLGLRTSFETDLSLLYRFDMNRPNGLMPTGHVELRRKVDYKNAVTLQVDGNYFPNDSWVGPGIYWEHKLDKKWKVITGAGASLSWQDGDYYSGFMPSVRVKYNNRYNLGFNANLFTDLGPFYGIVAAYEFTPDINTWYETRKEKSVVLKKEGTFENHEISISQIPISEMEQTTIEEMEKEAVQ